MNRLTRLIRATPWWVFIAAWLACEVGIYLA